MSRNNKHEGDDRERHSQIMAQFQQLDKRIDNLMATAADISAAVDALSTDVQALITEVQTLQANNANGVPPASLDPILTKLQAIDAAIKAVPPITPPTPAA